MEDVSKAYSSAFTALPLAFRITLYSQGTVPSFPQANLFAKTGTKSQSTTSSKTSGPKIFEDFGFDFYFVPWGYYLCGLGYCR